MTDKLDLDPDYTTRPTHEVILYVREVAGFYTNRFRPEHPFDVVTLKLTDTDIYGIFTYIASIPGAPTNLLDKAKTLADEINAALAAPAPF